MSSNSFSCHIAYRMLQLEQNQLSDTVPVPVTSNMKSCSLSGVEYRLVVAQIESGIVPVPVASNTKSCSSNKIECRIVPLPIVLNMKVCSLKKIEHLAHLIPIA